MPSMSNEAQISVAIAPMPARKTSASRRRGGASGRAVGMGTSVGGETGGAESTTVEGGVLVEVTGLEPVTFWLPAKRSPN